MSSGRRRVFLASRVNTALLTVSVALIRLEPFGMRGGSLGVAALQRGHGAPAPPQVQAFGPCQGRTGCFSQTQPQSSQRKHFTMEAMVSTTSNCWCLHALDSIVTRCSWGPQPRSCFAVASARLAIRRARHGAQTGCPVSSAASSATCAALRFTRGTATMTTATGRPSSFR